MNNKENSPFTPGSPVPVEFFVGRTEQIKELIRYIKQSANGKQENVFLIGSRGIGKSSLASFLLHFANNQENILGLHISLGRINTLEGMVRHILDQLLKEAQGKNWFKNIKDFFGKHIKEIGLFGISLGFNPPEEELKELTRRFPEVLYNLLEKIKKEKKGLLLILDDINGLAENTDFANWYKSFVDEIAIHYKHFPVFIILLGIPEKKDILAKQQPSLMRIFRIVAIEKLSDEEVKQFFTNTFTNAGIQIDKIAMQIMIHYSSGLPVLMQEIGDAIFWQDTDEIIDEKDAYAGLVNATEKVGQKYLDPNVYNAIRSPRYRSILRKLGRVRLNFHKKEIESLLNKDEKKVFNNFLMKMRKLGVIEPDIEGERGTYRFVNEIYRMYIWMESQATKNK